MSYSKKDIVKIIENALEELKRPQESDDASFWICLLAYLKEGEEDD